MPIKYFRRPRQNVKQLIEPFKTQKRSSMAIMMADKV